MADPLSQNDAAADPDANDAAAMGLAPDPAMEAEEDRTMTEAEEIAERAQYGQSGDMLDTTMGNMGGFGASGSGPDISQQSSPMPGNHADLPAGER